MDANKILEGILQDETVTYSYQEFCEICVIEGPLVEEMLDFGIIEVKAGIKEIKGMQKDELQSYHFTFKDLARAKKALRLHHDLNINWAGISLALDLLDEINELREQIAISRQSKQ